MYGGTGAFPCEPDSRFAREACLPNGGSVNFWGDYAGPSTPIMTASAPN